MAVPSLIQDQITYFSNQVKDKYQSDGNRMRPGTWYQGAIVGGVAQFPKIGQLISVPTAFQAQVIPQDPQYSNVSVNLAKFTTPSYVDNIEAMFVNFDAKAEQVKITAKAMGRRMDQLAIDALTASGTSNIVPVNYDGSNTNLTFSKIQQVLQYFDNNSVPEEDRYIAIGASENAFLLGLTEFDNSLYSQLAPNLLTSGSLHGAKAMSMNWIVIPNMPEGGLPVSSSIRTCYAWQKRTLAFAVGKDMNTEINYVPQVTSWLINGVFSAASKVIENTGVINILCDESVVL